MTSQIEEIQPKQESIELQEAKEAFFNFFCSVAGLRFTSREEFDKVVDALIKAAQKG